MLHLIVNVREVKYPEICSFYNNHKQSDWNIISSLNRAEGGFCVSISNLEDIQNAQYTNSKIKQLRWLRKRLVTPMGLTEFTLPELTLLYKSIAHVHGEENVFLECGPIY